MSPASRPPDLALRFSAAISAGLHVLVLAALLVSWRATSGPENAPPLEIEMIQSQAMIAGVPQPKPQPPPPPPQEGVGPTTPSPPPPPNVNVGNGPEQNDPLTVTGDNVVPPEPDSRFRNQPPPYPADAARAKAEGTVQLVMHVSAQGIPMDVRVAQSSGNDSLDTAARRAVQRWRFRPALQGGRAVPFDYVLNIRFAIGDHP